MRVQGMLFGMFLVALTVLISCGASKDIRFADNLVDRGRYTEALEVYRRCLAVDPHNKKIEQKLVETKQLESRRLMTMAYTRLQHNDFETAFDLYADAVRYDPTNTEAHHGLETARDNWADVADHLEQTGKFEEALAIHKRILREFRDFPRSMEAMQRIRSEQAMRYVDQARRYRKQGLPGNALIAYLHAQSLVPDLPGIQEAFQEAKKELEQSIQFQLGITRSPGSQFKPSLWALYLNGVFEKSNLPIVLVSGHQPTPYQVVLRGKLSPVRTVTRRIQATIKVEDGVARTPNRAHAALKDKVKAAEARVKQLEPQVLQLQNKVETLSRERIRTGSGTAGPEEEDLRRQLAEVSKPYREAVAEYRRLSAQLARIPEYFEKPVYRTETYPAKEVRRWVRVHGEVKILTADGNLLDTLSLDDSIEVRDITHRAIKASRTRPAIPKDPLTLPSPQELRVQAESRAMAKLQSALQNLYDDHVERLWQAARRFALDGKTEEATEAFLRAFLSDPSHPTDEVTRYILEAKQALPLPLESFLLTLVEEPSEAFATPIPMAR